MPSPLLQPPRPSLWRRLCRFALRALGVLLVLAVLFFGWRAWAWTSAPRVPIDAWRPASTVIWARANDLHGAWTRLMQSPAYRGPKGSDALEEAIRSLWTKAPCGPIDPLNAMFRWIDADTLLRDYGAEAFLAARPAPPGPGVDINTPPELMGVGRLPFLYFCGEPFLPLARLAGVGVETRNVAGFTVRRLSRGNLSVWLLFNGPQIVVATSEAMITRAAEAAAGRSGTKREPLPAPGKDEVVAFGLDIAAIPRGTSFAAQYERWVRSVPLTEILHPVDPMAVQEIAGTLSMDRNGLRIEGRVRTDLEKAEPRIRAQHTLSPAPPSPLTLVPSDPVFVEVLRTDIAGSWPWVRDNMLGVTRRQAIDPRIGDTVKAVYGLLNAFLEPLDRNSLYEQVFPSLGPDLVLSFAPGASLHGAHRPLIVMGIFTEVREPLALLSTLDEFVRQVGARDPGGPLSLERLTVGPYEAHVLRTHFEKFGELCYGLIDGWLVVTSSLDYFEEIVETRLGSRSSAATQDSITRDASEARRNGSHCFAWIDGGAARRTLLDFREEAARIVTDRIDRKALRSRLQQDLLQRGGARGPDFEEALDRRVQDAVERAQSEARHDVERAVQSVDWLQSLTVNYRIQGATGRYRVDVRFTPPSSSK